VAAEVADHVTQRGSARQFLLASEAERFAYLDLLREAVRGEAWSVVGYGVMSNHVHRVLIPHRVEALALALKSTHGRYASYWNASHALSGHAWQGRFYSCPLDEGHGWQALRDTELNPVRAGLAAEAATWRWSSAAAHSRSCRAGGLGEPDACLGQGAVAPSLVGGNLAEVLGGGRSRIRTTSLATLHSYGASAGGAEFIRKLEQETRRCLTPRQGGRPPKGMVDKKQEAFSFAK